MNHLLLASWVAVQSLLSTNAPVVAPGLDNFVFEFQVAGTNAVVVRRDGVWQPGRARAVVLDASKLRVSANVMTGTLRWDGVAGELVAQLATFKPDQGKPDATGMQFWKIQPQTASVIATVAGEFRGARLTGRLVTLGGTGRWSLGRWENGLRLDLDMGTQRQNWNHARIAVQPFTTPQDWRQADGVRLTVTTSQPRRDAAVSFWVSEEDGSWYCVKSAVPLSHTNNEAVLWFEDFAEAEWVAPGNHMDEDYVLDRAGIAALGVGVVNPLGVGRVSFTVTGIELVKREPVVESPAQLEVTGRLLTANRPCWPGSTSCSATPSFTTPRRGPPSSCRPPTGKRRSEWRGASSTTPR